MSDDNSLEQISDEDREFLKIAKGVAMDPKTRTEYLRLLKKKHPETAIPEVDMEDKINAMVESKAKPYIDKVAKMEADALKKEVEGRIAEQRRLLKEQGYSQADVDAIEKLMTEKQIPSHATAAEHFSMSKKLAQPTPNTLTRTASNILPVDKKALKESGGVKNWARNEAFKAADDIKSGRVKLH